MAQRRYYRQIVIRYVTAPKAEKDLDSELDYIYQCLGLGDERDEVGRAVFRALVKANMRGEGISSRDIMELSAVSQAAVIYHLNIFKRSGLVVKDGRNYYLRGRTLVETLGDMENDMHRRFQNLKEIAKKVESKASPVSGNL